MAPFIEANTLSDITQIAGNPPKYPRNPTEKKRQPLTLYIARVPGSKDIILTTLKPQRKNVTAEDVTSSLYFLHLDNEDDALLLPDAAAGMSAWKEASTIVQKPLPRKPLPQNAGSSLDLGQKNQSLNAAEEAISNLTERGPESECKDWTPESSMSDHSQPSIRSKFTFLRRPLGPRPFLSESVIGRKPLAGNESLPFPSRGQSQTEAQPQTQAQAQPQTQAQAQAQALDATSPSRISNEITNSCNSSHSDTNYFNREAEPVKFFSVTLIRRDPYSGAQWNIGTVVGEPTLHDGHDSKLKGMSPSRKSHVNISINLTTPGYSYFRNSQSTYHNGTGGTRGEQPLPTKNTHFARNDTVTGESQVPGASGGGFDRQVRMEGFSFWDRTTKPRRRAQADISGKGRPTHERTGSESSAASVSEALPEDRGSGASRDSSTKGYVFTSPWGGRCKFSTGGGGRTLRCKHTLPGPVSVNSAAGLEYSLQTSVLVSELRFNLPSSTAFHTPTVTEARGAESVRFNTPKLRHAESKLSPQKVLPPLPPRPHPTSYAAMYPSDEDEPPPLPSRSCSTEANNESNDEEKYTPISHMLHPSVFNPTSPPADEETRLDLSLGQEKAGGGNRGKRAKLGKLIVHDEGVKMLDLVVAANMGVWWSIWGSDHR